MVKWQAFITHHNSTSEDRFRGADPLTQFRLIESGTDSPTPIGKQAWWAPSMWSATESRTQYLQIASTVS